MNIKKFFLRLKPDYYRGESNEGSWSTFRWFGTGWDSIHRKDGFRYIQFGNRPVRFVAKVVKGNMFPLFVCAAGFDTVFCKWGFRIGTTRRPKNFRKLRAVVQRLRGNEGAVNGNRYRKRVRTEREPSRLL